MDFVKFNPLLNCGDVKEKEMIKKFALVTFVLLTLSACGQPAGPELSSLPEDYFREEVSEERTVEHLTDSNKESEYSAPTTEFPSGDFVILRSLPGMLYKLSLYIDNTLICTWDHEVSDPRSFKDTNRIFIAEATCASIGEEVVTWELENKFAVRTIGEEFVSFVDIWYVTGSQYFPLANNH